MTISAIRRLLAFVSVSLLLPLWTSSAFALVIDDHEIESIIPATSQHPELRLNGASMRVLYGVVDTYIGKLYVENPTTDEKLLVESDQYKRMVFHIAMKRVSGRRIAKALYDALQLNLTEEEALALEDRLQLMVEMFDETVHRGEEGYIEWVPGLGSRIVLDGHVKGVIAGKDVYDAILEIWVGENPVGTTFKNQILGLEEYQEPKSTRRRGRR